MNGILFLTLGDVISIVFLALLFGVWGIAFVVRWFKDRI